MLVEKLSLTPDFQKLFDGKVIAGSSAGVAVLSTYYWSNTEKRVEEGFGVLSIKTKCHFHPEETEAVEKLLAISKDLPVLTLAEYHWVVMYQ